MRPVDVYFDYASPFAYIASEILPEFSDRHGLRLCWKPIDLLGLGNYADGLPYSPLKRQYVFLDATRTAQFYGVSMSVPKPLPVQSKRALRLALLTLDEPGFPELHSALFRAAWHDQRDLSSREVLIECASHIAGGSAWVDQVDSAGSEALLATATSEAEGRGVFGVPTFVLEDEPFWGTDSLPVLRWRLDHPAAKP